MNFFSVETAIRQLEVAEVFSILNSHTGVAPSPDISYTMQHLIVQENVMNDEIFGHYPEIDCHWLHNWELGGQSSPTAG